MINKFLEEVREKENEATGRDSKKGMYQDPAQAFLRRIGEVSYLEPCRMTDSELDLMDLLKVMPDTWNNVPWTVVNGIEVIKRACLDQRRMMEEIKTYSIKTNEKIIRSTVDFI